MSKSQTLSQIMAKNKAAKVSKLSDIAKLFEQESRLNAQAMELNQFNQILSAQTEVESSELNKLPREFLKQEQSKREKLLATLLQCRQEIVNRGEEVKNLQRLKLEELQRIDARIKAVRDKANYEASLKIITREVLESEDYIRNV